MRARALSLQHRALVVELDVLIHTQTHTTHTHAQGREAGQPATRLTTEHPGGRLRLFGLLSKGPKTSQGMPHSQKSTI